MKEKTAPEAFMKMAEAALAYLPEGTVLARAWREPLTSHCGVEYVCDGQKVAARVPYDWAWLLPEDERGAALAEQVPLKRKGRKRG